MWDFSVGKAISAIIRTTPFILLRLAVYFGIGFAYLIAAGVGAVVGYGFGHMGASPDAPAGGAFWGALVGFGLTSAVLYFAREYLLYLVKAAHIAVLVEIYDGKPIPAGQRQVSYGAEFVKTHFAEASVLFGVDQIVKAVLRVITGTLHAITAFLPIPALQTVIRFVNAVLRVSLTYVDELILAYLIRTRTTNPWESAQDALILYAQNYKHFLKNAIWLAVFMWGITLVIFLVLVGPAAALVAVMPSHSGIWVVAVAFIFAWALKAAILEPFAIAALMQVFFKTIEGQTPDLQWSERLSTASHRFRELATRAAGYAPKPAPGASPAAGPAPAS
jgi:hypothetical protein